MCAGGGGIRIKLEKIASVHNPLIGRLKSLREARGRKAEGLFLVEGEKLMREALEAGLRGEIALIEEERLEQFSALCGLLTGAGVQVKQAPRRLIEAVCDTCSPQGACCAFEPPRPMRIEAAPARLVALDGVQDPGNVGTIWRTADAAGFGGLLLGPGCADALSPKVQRAAMGSGFRLPVANPGALAPALAGLRERGYKIIISALNGQSFYARAPLGERYALVIGSEARGVSEEVAGVADVRLKLPMRGGAESLNAAVAAGIMMYELTRDL